MLSECSGAHAAEGSIVTEEFMIAAADPGTGLFLRNKHPDDVERFPAERILLYVHGATQPSEATFDLALEGLSWMDYIARDGWDVYLVDVRGYGRSTRPEEMDHPADANPPIVTTDVATRDVGAAVDFILKRREVARINLMGWSWGTATMAKYASEHSDKVESLVLYAPLWCDMACTYDPATAKPSTSAGSGAYSSMPMEVARQRLQKGAPDDKRVELLSDAAFEAWSAAALASDPVGARQDPPVLRSPNGHRKDYEDYWGAGKSYYDPARITVPTLVVVGEWDWLTPSDGARALFDALSASPGKRFVEIGEGTHILMIEKNRMQLFQEVQRFLADHHAQP